MWRALFLLIAVILSRSASARSTAKVHGLTYCTKHHIPTISVIGYHSVNTHDKLVLVHDWSPESLRCDPNSPNRLADDRKFHRTKIHSVRGIITFCPLCDADYWHCRGGDRHLTDAEVRQITALALRQSKFRRPILHIFAVYSPNAVVIGGHEEHIGDVFSDIGFEKRSGKWIVAYPISSHRIVAIGRDDL